MADSNHAITSEFIAALRASFNDDPKSRLMQNAVSNVNINQVALNRSIVTNADHSFSIKLDDWKVTNQKSSGRCWLFAGLNLLRFGAMKKMNIKEFEFSQNYTLFWDKFERANYFLENIIETISEPLDERLVAFLLKGPINDGGQWNMFANLINRHGLVPKAAMPETESSSTTRNMNPYLYAKLRQNAMELREAASNGASETELRAAKAEMLKVIFRMLCIHLGTPPERFTWQWRDKDDEFHRDENITPQEFAGKYVTIPIDEYVCIVHDPRESSPFNRTFTVKFLGNIVGGEIVKYLNVDIETMKGLAVKTLEGGEPVWFGCDTGKMMERKIGIWDVALYDYNLVYDTEFKQNKANRLLYGQTAMSHAMLFTGVDIVDGKPRRWRVENSWGEESGEKGFFLMNDNWFDEFMFETAVRKSELPQHLQEALEIEPIILPPWDPMGSLASEYLSD